MAGRGNGHLWRPQRRGPVTAQQAQRSILGLFRPQSPHRALDLAIPAQLINRFRGGRLGAGFGLRIPRTRHNQPRARPGQRHIQKPRAFGGLVGLAARAGLSNGNRRSIAAGFPNRQPAGQQIDFVTILRVTISGVRQDDNRRLKPLRPMRGHHADLVPGGVHLALDGHVIGFHPDQEPRQAGHIRRLIGQRLRQKLVDPVLGLIPQTRQKPFAPVVPGQRPFDQIKGPQEIRLIAQVPQHLHGLGMPRAVA